MKNILYSIIFIVLPLLCKSNQFSVEEKHQIDSINNIISNVNNEDTLLANAYLSLSQFLYMSSFDTMYYLSDKSRQIAEKGLVNPKNEAIKLSLMKSLAIAYGNMGYVLKYQGKNEEALSYYQKSLELSKNTNDPNGASSMYNNIGLIYGNQGNIKKALGYFNQCLKIRLEIDDKKGLATIYNNIGAEYRKQGDNEKTLEYYKKSMSYSKQINDERNLGRNLNNIGFVYYSLNKKDTALMYWNESLMLRKKIGDEYGIAESLTNLALEEENNDKLDVALKYLLDALNKYEKLGVKNSSVSNILARISGIYYKKNKIETALGYGMRGLDMAQENGFLDGIMSNTKNLYIINKNLGKDKLALKMHELYVTAKDSIQSNTNRQEVLKNEYKLEYEKQHLSDSIAYAKQREIKEIEISRQKAEISAKRNQQFVLYGGLLVVLIFAGVTYNRFKMSQNQKAIIEEQKYLVEEKNREITDSIQYAKRIQSAILPPNKVVKEYLKESFILYKPKDIVAGDFYWLETINSGGLSVVSDENPSLNAHHSQLVLFAAADCTGHGVPGAMVSVVCNNGLNRSVREYGLTDPGKILNKTREIVIQEFEKSVEDVKDGMDIALCSLDGKTLKYAGANNPLWIIRNGSKEIEEIKANKQPIGKYSESISFTTHTIELEKGDSIYIFSDGYVDQFGGDKGKKYKAANFKSLLISLQSLPMENQLSIINETFENWKGNLEQIDDVCVIGVRF